MLRRSLWTKRIAVKKTVLFHAAFTASGKKNGDLFFNRVEEIQKKTTLLEGGPQFTVLLGPLSSGKTRFIRHVVEQKDPHLMVFQQAKFFPLFLDLRGVKVNEEDWLAMAFEKEVEKFGHLLKSVEASENGVRVDFGLRETRESYWSHQIRLVCVQNNYLTSSIYLTAVLKLASDFVVDKWAKTILRRKFKR
jgi:hypothetical protein